MSGFSKFFLSSLMPFLFSSLFFHFGHAFQFTNLFFYAIWCFSFSVSSDSNAFYCRNSVQVVLKKTSFMSLLKILNLFWALLSIWIMVTLNFPVSFSIPWIVSFSLLPPESRYYPHLYLRAGCGSQQCFWLILSSVFSSFPRDVSTTVKDVSGTSWEHWSFLSALPFPVWYSVLRTQLRWHPQLLPLSRSWHLLAPLGLLFRR